MLVFQKKLESINLNEEEIKTLYKLLYKILYNIGGENND